MDHIRESCFVFVFCIATTIPSASQTFNTLHGFAGTDGANPLSGLLQGADGNFYGTTIRGGANNTCPPENGCGTIFQITPAGQLTTLQSFGGADGANPESGLIQASNGEFYGTTASTIYSIVPGGTPVVLANVGSDAPLIQGTDGNFYGTTAGGEPDGCSGNCGTVFKMTPAGTVTTLYTFDGTGGFDPQSG